ncbi:unnamed protein product [Trypanosoma congolense IL3000]|uniref:WGS project CAEQ00000000 data, annotated contig 2241 n=1 Tax=Trypanosoma congolense (strain IL3000) TaxID=1068625 RepID=F9WCK1_TRYCI|nr:unnamed protein product [Trypanosoma congolense IL3000]
MDLFFFQVIDRETLTHASLFSVGVELLCAVIVFVIVGVLLRVLPQILVVWRRKHRSLRHEVKEETERALMESSKVPTGVSRNEVCIKRAVVAVPQENGGNAKNNDITENGEGKSLDDALDAFFTEESMLHEALLDVSTGSTVKTKQEKFLKALAPPKESVHHKANGRHPPSARANPTVAAPNTEGSLDEALERFFDEENLLDEALLGLS